ncbi:MAG: sulfatase-like hydrolase/transferase, partial [Planctomycetaceae bacterium]
MTSRLFLLLFVGLVQVSIMAPLRAPAADRPNILFMLTDDQRWDAAGIAGHPHLKTPHIDRLGHEGIYFRNSFCTTSLCSPSRASILSGRYPEAVGMTKV